MKGSCHCKRITYTLQTKPKSCGLCYCKTCQISSGSDHSVYMACRQDSVEVTGEVKWYSCSGGSGLSKQKGFCSHCGSNLFGKLGSLPGIMIVYAGSLEDSSQCQPKTNLWVEKAPHWVKIDDTLKCFEKNFS